MATVSREGASIYYEVYGSGPAIAFAHGAGGNSMSWWQQVPHFSRRYTVVVFDHRTFGRSACSPGDFHPRHFADDLFAILDAEGIDRAALVCQSMGGWTGLRAALERPERVAALVLAGTPGGLLSERIAENMAKIGERIGAGGVVSNAALAPEFPRRSPAMAFLYDRINALNTGFDPATLVRSADESARTLPEALSGYAVPTLVLSGEEDLLFPPEVLREVAELIPGAEIRSFPGVGHSTYFEDPDRFNRVVEEFLAKHLPA
jgi:pimeloyl-ACP methyl ester carboxylesterase